MGLDLQGGVGGGEAAEAVPGGVEKAPLRGRGGEGGEGGRARERNIEGGGGGGEGGREVGRGVIEKIERLPCDSTSGAREGAGIARRAPPTNTEAFTETDKPFYGGLRGGRQDLSRRVCAEQQAILRRV